jgi:trimeric autotransporter adhesin
MSTKTTFKRVALVTVAALGFGLLSSVTPASAQISQSISAVVGPNGATSLTVVGGDSATTGALVRLDVVSNDSTTLGLALNESITASVTAGPTGANLGAVNDTSTRPAAGRSDFSVLAMAAQTSGTAGATAAATRSGVTNWSRITDASLDTATANASGVIGSPNTRFTVMDGNRTTTVTGTTIASYYVTVRPRPGSDVMNKGAYTFSFALTDANGVLRGTSTVKIDFVSTAATSGATVAIAQNGTFLANTALLSYDTVTTSTYATLTLRNRDGGLVRNNSGQPVTPSATIQWIRTGFLTSDTTTLSVEDSGTLGSDFGTTLGVVGDGTLRAYDGVYGLTAAALPSVISATGNTYQIWAAYGNAPIVTSALTIFATSGAGTASAANTDVLVTAAGMSAADQLVKTTATTAFTLPTTTKTATIKFTIQTSSDTNTPAAAITVTPTWSGAHGTASVTPATSTTGTVYTTDALGNFTVTVTNDAPISGASVALVLSGGAAFGAATQTTTLTWATPVAASISLSDPLSGVYVKTGSTNVTTITVKDQFGGNVANQGVSVSLAVTPAPAVASTTVIAPLTTDAKGQATYSLTGGAASTKEVLTFACVPVACSTTATRTMEYNYVATVPVVATLTGYYGYTHTTAGTTLVPAAGIYQSGTTTPLALRDNRDISKSLLTYADSAADDMLSLQFLANAAGSVAALGAVVTVTAGDGAWILNSSGLPSKSRNFLVTSTGYTGNIQVLATKTGAITFTATSGTVTATTSMWVANATADARFVKITSAATGTANGTGTPVTVTVTDRYDNPVSGVALNVVASGVGSFMGGNITQSFTTDASGAYTFLATTNVSEGGVAKFTATSGTSGTSMSDAAGFHGATEVDSTLAAGNASASTSITFAAGSSATDVAQAATDAAAEATDAANAATDAANAAAEAADAATAAAQDAADAVAALSTQVSEMVSALKKQITALTNLVIKIQKKVNA